MLVIVFLFLTFIAEILGVFRFADLNTWKDAVEHEKAAMAIWVALVVLVKGRAPPQIPRRGQTLRIGTDHDDDWALEQYAMELISEKCNKEEKDSCR